MPDPSTPTAILIAASIDADRRLAEEKAELAQLLADRGHIVFRFDYRGQGQSFGRAIDLDLDTMAQDIADALSWLELTGSIQNTAILAVGLGAAAAAATGNAGGLPLAAWEPILDFDSLVRVAAGPRLVNEMGFETVGSPYDGHSLADLVGIDLASDELVSQGFFDAGGFQVGTALRDSLAAVSLRDAVAVRTGPLLVAASSQAIDINVDFPIDQISRESLVRTTALFLDRSLSRPASFS